MATYLNIDPKSSFTPPAWQNRVGTVIVTRKDKLPLLPQHVEVIWDYGSRILDWFGEGEGAPVKLYNRAAFQKYWDNYWEEQKKFGKAYSDGKEGNAEGLVVKSPYEV